MKYEITERSNVMPEVGQAWRHFDCIDVYLRIPDAQGRKAMGHEHNECFYSVNMTTGGITTTRRDASNIEVATGATFIF